MKLLVTVSALALAGTVANAATIDLVSDRNIFLDADGSAPTDGFAGGRSAYGQTFSVTDGGKLTSFGFEILLDAASPDVDFEAFVYEWDGSSITGTSLFSTASNTSVGTNAGGTPTGELVTVSVASDVNLLAGTSYAIIFAPTSGGPKSLGAIASNLPGGVDYGGGELIYSSSFFVDSSSNPAAFNGEFMSHEFLDLSSFLNIEEVAAVPIAGAFPLMATGLAAFGFAGWRRRSS